MVYGISRCMELHNPAIGEEASQLKIVGKRHVLTKAAQSVADQWLKEEHATTRAGTSSPCASSDRGR